MDFTLTADQRLLVDSVTTLLAGACKPAVVRSVAEGDRDAARPLWRHLADYAALGDGPVCDQALVSERLGWACAPGPWFVSSALALPLLRAAGHDRADAVAAGEVAATVAWAGTDGTWARQGADGSLRTFLLDLDLADVIVVVGPKGIDVVAATDGRPITWLDLTRTASAVDVADPPAGSAIDLGAVLDRATVVLAAEACGTARRLLELAVAYAGERVQFDRPIGSFQSIQHLLADLALDVERAWAGVQWAAMLLDAESADRAEAARAVHAAKAAANEAAMHASLTSIQVHGGIGYTWEHDLHLWLRRAATTAHLLGTADEHHDALGELLAD